MHNRLSFWLLCCYLAPSHLIAAQEGSRIFLKNINQDRDIFVSLGFKIQDSGTTSFFSRKEPIEPYFISLKYSGIEKRASIEIFMPDVRNCKDVKSCMPLVQNLDPAALSLLEQELAKKKVPFSKILPVVVASWSKDLFADGQEYLSTKKSIEDTGAYILTKQEPSRHYLDVVEWKNIGANLQAGFVNTIENWQRQKEPPYVQVVGSDQEYVPLDVAITSYANYPLYMGVIACDVDITSIHEARTCAFANDIKGNPLPLLRLEKDKKQSISFAADIRALDYYKQRPKAFGAVAMKNPYQIYLIASPFKEDLDPRPRKPGHTISLMRNALTNTRYHRIASIDIVDSGYKNFYLYQNNNGINFFVGDYVATDLTNKLMNKLASIAAPWSASIVPIGQHYIDNMLRYLKKSTDQNVAKVIDRTNPNDALSDAEKKSLAAIKENIHSFIKEGEKKRLTHYLPKNFSVDDIKSSMIPNLALAASGGGYRALLATMGFKNGLYNNRVDPLFLYQAGLSGSTWYLSKFLHMAQNDWSHKKNNNARVINSNFYRKLNDDLRVRPQYNSAITNFLSFPDAEKEHGQLLAFFSPMLVRWAYLQEISLVDVMGAGLWYNLFRDSAPFDLKLSNFQNLMTSGQVPFTLMTSVTKTKAMLRDDYLWFEFSPFEIGATIFNRFVETSSFGRYFYKGSSVDTAPELILPFYMGIWGSAMSAGILDGIRQEVIPKGFQLKAELPFIAEFLDFAKMDYPAIATIAAIKAKYDLDKSDAGELLRYGIKYLDKQGLLAVKPANKATIERLKQKLIEAESKLSQISPSEYEFDIDKLSWLYQEEAKPYAAGLYSAQPDRVSMISSKLATAEKLSELQAFSGAIVGNPYYEMDFAGNMLRDLPAIELRDGGVDFNIPFPPLVKDARNMDIIVAFDASPDVFDKVKALENGCLYAKRHNIKRFPVEECLALYSDPDKKKQLISDAVTVIGDPDSLDQMTIIYVPLKTISKEKYENVKGAFKKDYQRYIDWNPHNDITGTMNLRYSPAEVDELAGFGEMLGDIVSNTVHDVFERKLRKGINAHKM